MQDRIEWIDILKGISIVLVVYYHAVLLPYSVPFNLSIFDRTILDSANYFFIYNLAPLRMPLFFMISGFLVSNSVVNKSWKAVWHSRVGTYIYVFAIWAIIQNLLVGLMGGGDLASNNTSTNSIYAVTVSEFLSAALRGVSSLWYLYALVIFFVVTKMSNMFPRVLILIAFILSVYTGVEPLDFPYNSMLYCFLFFVFGVFWGKWFFSGIENLPFKSNAVLVLCGIGVVLISRYLGVQIKLFDSFLAIYFLTLATIYLFNVGLPLNVFSYIGKNTLPIYIIHRPLIEFFMLFIIPWTLDFSLATNSNHILYSVLTPLTITIFCILFSIIFWKATNISYGRYLYGYKFRPKGNR